MDHQTNNFYIVEGDNGVGKTKTIKNIQSKIDITHLSTPGKTYQSIREEINTKGNIDSKFLFYMSSNYFIEPNIKQNLETKDVICDRYITSSFIDYMIIANLPLKDVEPIFKLFNSRLLQPDMTFLLRCDHEKRVRRIGQRPNNSVNDNLTEEYSRRTNELYKVFAEINPDKWYIIDNTHKSIDEVAEEIIGVMNDIRN